MPRAKATLNIFSVSLAIFAGLLIGSIILTPFLFVETPKDRYMRVISPLNTIELADIEIATVKIYVNDPSGNPVANAIVDVDIQGLGYAKGNVDLSMLTDKNGYCEDIILSNGVNLYLTVTHPSYQQLYSGPHNLEGFPGEHTYTIHLSLVLKSTDGGDGGNGGDGVVDGGDGNGGDGGSIAHTLTVYVVDPDGKRVYGTLVQLDSGEEHKTNEDGKTLFYNVPTGTHELYVKGSYKLNIFNTHKFEWTRSIFMDEKDTSITIWAYDGAVKVGSPPIQTPDVGELIVDNWVWIGGAGAGLFIVAIVMGFRRQPQVVVMGGRKA